MSSPAPPPENSPLPDASPLPLENPISPPAPLPLPPETTTPAPVGSPPSPALLPPPAPVGSPPSPALLPPPAPVGSPPSPALLPPPAPPLPSPISPALPLIPSFTPPPVPPESSPRPPLISPSAPAETTLTSPPPALSNEPPAPVTTVPPAPPVPALPTNPSPPVISSPAVPMPPARTKAVPKSPSPWSHSSRSPASSSSRPPMSHFPRSKTLPSTKPISPPAPAAPEPVAPASQPTTGGGTGDDMPFTAEKPAPQPSVPLVVGGGAPPAMAALPVGANGSSDLQAGGGGGRHAAGVSTGIVSGLCVGGVVLVVLVVFGVLLAFCRRKRGSNGDDCGSFACNGKADMEGKPSLPSHTNRNTSFPDTETWGSTNNPHQPPLAAYSGGSGSANSASTMALAMLSSGTFTYEELVAATGGFSEANLLGQGGFGFVHKGVLPNGKEVAVKQLKMGGHQGEREFQAEVETISQVHHKHLVSLVGYCIAGDERLLVYEFVPNKTLEFHLHGKDQPVMEWSTRLKIAIGSAKGLAYLHEDCNPTIIHRDIKAANILLDFNCEAKVSDFGLAKIFSNANSSVTHITTRVVGTFGYLAPEYASSGKVTDKSDVYSYGVMLLELITGRPPIESANGSLVNWARPLLAQAIEEGNFDTLVDPRLQSNYDATEMANMVACAAACVRLSAWRRPRMSQVIRALEGDLSPSDLDDGVRPGHSSTHFPYSNLDFDSQKYMEDMKRFRMALVSSNGADHTGRYSENTSEYGLNPSVSSADSDHTTREA